MATISSSGYYLLLLVKRSLADENNLNSVSRHPGVGRDARSRSTATGRIVMSTHPRPWFGERVRAPLEAGNFALSTNNERVDFDLAATVFFFFF